MTITDCFNLCQQTNSLELLFSARKLTDQTRSMLIVNMYRTKCIFMYMCISFVLHPVGFHFEKEVSLKYILHYVIYYYYFHLLSTYCVLVCLQVLGSQRRGNQESRTLPLVSLKCSAFHPSTLRFWSLYFIKMWEISSYKGIHFCHPSIIILSHCFFILKS